MIPFFALIGLVTVISIIVNLQINRHSLFCKITGTTILILACIFACFVILFPLSFGSYQNLILSFGIAFVLLIGIYVFVGLTANKRRFKNVAFVATEGDADTSESDNTKALAKPVQLKHVAVPQTHKIHRTAAQTSTESKLTLPDFVQPEYRDTSSLLDSMEKARPKNLGRDFGMQLETGAIEEVSNMEAERIEDGLMEGGVNAAKETGNLQGEVSVKNVEHNDSGESAIEDAADMQAEPAVDPQDAEQIESIVLTPEDDTDLYEKQEVNEIADEQVERGESADANAADIQENQVGENSDSEQLDSDESAVEDIVDLYDEREVSDIDIEQTYSVASDNAVDVQIADEYGAMDVEQTDSVDSADTEASDIQEDQMAEDSKVDSDESAVEADADEQTVDEDSVLDVKHIDSDESAAEDVNDVQTADEDSVINDGQTLGGESATEDVNDVQTVDEDSVINDGQTVSSESATEDVNDDRIADEESVIDAGEAGDEIIAVQEDKYSRVITKAIELKGNGEYLNTIFMLQSVYDKVKNEAVIKQIDILLLECLVLSKQYLEGQKKWFEILSKRYDFRPEEKAKLKAVMGQLNAGQL